MNKRNGTIFVLTLALALVLSMGTVADASPRPPAFADPATLARPNGSWSSGWVDFVNSPTTFTHNLGGDPALYAVELWFRDNDTPGLGISQRAYGSDVIGAFFHGAYWRQLTDTSIVVVRQPNDAIADQIYLRIWQPEPPEWDSGWQDIAPGQTLPLNHNLGGNADDYLVGIKFNDIGSDPFGINHHGYGGLESPGFVLGAAWLNLTNTSIQVMRFADDTTANQVRVQISRPTTAPAFDSGWHSVGQGVSLPIAHNLGGNLNAYRIRYSQRSTAHGINTLAVGRKEFNGNYLGASWENLTTSAVTVHRAANDIYAQEARVRILLPTYSLYLPLVLR